MFDIEHVFTSQADDDSDLRPVIDSMMNRVEQLELESTSLSDTLNTLMVYALHQLHTMRDVVDHLTVNVNDMFPPRPSPEPANRGQFTAVACRKERMTLSCPHQRRISITSAVFGMYRYSHRNCWRCSCPPNPVMDCTETMEESSPGKWLSYKEQCDNQTRCQVDNAGSLVRICDNTYTEYTQVFYECLPDDVTAPVGFTAFTDICNSKTYHYNDIIVFEEVISNFGGHYNPETSSFVCPADGVYMISVHMLARKSQDVVADIMRNREKLVGIRIDSAEGQFNGDSGMIVADGFRGDVIWISQGYNATGRIYAANQRIFFTCFLLYRF